MAQLTRRRRLLAAVLSAAALGWLGGVAPVWSEPAPTTAPTCTPELVHALAPGDVDVSGGGVAHADRLTIRSAGRSVVDEPATITWQVQATVESTGRQVGTGPTLGGGLTLDIRTESGARLQYATTCVAGAGAWATGVIFYGNGMRMGWPGLANGPTFVHFEAWEADAFGPAGVYVALVDGRDCSLDFASLAVTRAPHGLGDVSLTGLPTRPRYSETDCSALFGDPKPAARAPGLGLS
ncbi:MAG TPA: hypothetical protein VFT81_05570 [Dermatophilaceae bacterium]|nr:hypothetical protein [Dermatophilaceae bacterium]